mmetsp:Transcript_16349/g.41460  ORF Transcript_16349/g.41460 Transcript_16349/m.41460 type:complete len:306 (+) Transcript_16349:191-1108(+)|eukprot:CAMPEP_0113916684 /NCGR_PEP_ID=MMETSP0780_2-20120614/32217_1 /TAXON_ID=652834 /ORGANISM="Palpitomonas bilix" /LENGTH=305 /DNA_ID=CAMNT_0000915977 /DNA_START=301 /DNA_END=1218 /DNA_ORIENTATION=- /assembly_acc=CAM_ASM_000599
MPYKDVLGDKFLQGRVVDVKNGHLVLEDGSQQAFDYLVLSVGSSTSSTVTKASMSEWSAEKRKQSLQATAERLQKANSVLIVGGGPVGVELAAELACAFGGSKTVNVVHSRDRLLADLKESIGQKALAWLTKHNVNVRLGEKVNLENGEEGRKFKTTGGADIEGDVIFQCTGVSINTAFLKNCELISPALNQRGEIAVDATFKVQGMTNVFAIGDCASTGEAKLGFHARLHSKHLEKFFKKVLAGKKALPSPYKFKLNPMGLVSLGSNAGVGQFGGLSVPNFLVRAIKSKNLLIPRTRKEVGFLP